MKGIQKKISWLVFIAMTFVMTVVYICPMTLHVGDLAVSDSPSLCQSVGSVHSNARNAVGCLGSHLAVIGQFTGDVPHVMTALLALALFCTAWYYFFRNFLSAITRPLLSRLRHIYLYYQTFIKLFVEKRILSYLSFLGNYTVALLA